VLRRRASGVALCLVTVPLLLAGARGPSLTFGTFVAVGQQLGDVVWTGKQFLYVPERTGEIYASDADGGALRLWATVPIGGEEMRCVVAAAGHGFRAGDVFCHAPNEIVYQISPDGHRVTPFATLPTQQASDGGLAFDTVGRFGYALLAASGGSSIGPGGAVFAVRADGSVRRVGFYGGPGGAENVAVAPRAFGPFGGQLLLTIDQGDRNGRLVAMTPSGHVRVLAAGLDWGLNPIAVVTAPARRGGMARPGLYLSDYTSKSVLFAEASELRSFVGSVIVGTERKALIYVVRPRRGGVRVDLLSTNLGNPDYNLEGAAYVG
jgi:hypothetical protein